MLRSKERHHIERVRHELVRRTLTVTRVEHASARMRRISFASPSLARFISSAPDDHVKLFFPVPGAEAAMRDYTPRTFDPARCTLSIEFALHEAGPATAWALQARVGDKLEMAGPRASRVVADDFDWYLLIADESALPALGRWLEVLRPRVPVTTIACIADEAERQRYETQADWQATWLSRGEPSARDTELVLAALERLTPAHGDGFVWIAGEASLARSVRSYILNERHHPRAWLRASGYWQRGTPAAHIDLED